MAKTCDAGNVVVFTREGGFIVPESRAKQEVQRMSAVKDNIDMNKERGVHVYNIWVKKQGRNTEGKRGAGMRGSRREVSVISGGHGLELRNRYDALGEDTYFMRQGHRIA